MIYSRRSFSMTMAVPDILTLSDGYGTAGAEIPA